MCFVWTRSVAQSIYSIPRTLRQYGLVCLQSKYEKQPLQ